MPIITSFNGQLTDKMPILDRGFLYGDSVYEVCPGYGDKLFLYEEHLARMKRNAELLKIPAPFGNWDSILPLIQKLRPEHPGKDHYVRWIVSRGVSQIHLKIFDNHQSNLVIIVADINEHPPEVYEKGIKLHISKVERTSKKALDPKIKSGNYLNNILGLDDALKAGFDDTLMLNPEGEITEAAMSNIFFIAKNGEVHSPRLEAGILDGITRNFIVHNVFPKLNLKFKDMKIFPKDLSNYNECFLTASIKGVTGIYQIDNFQFNSCKSDSMTKKIMTTYNTMKRSP